MHARTHLFCSSISLGYVGQRISLQVIMTFEFASFRVTLVPVH